MNISDFKIGDRVTAHRFYHGEVVGFSTQEVEVKWDNDWFGVNSFVHPMFLISDNN
jgi:hypothetical protein